MKFKAIIFDFDGVLFDSERIHFQACNQAFNKLGFTISEEEYFQHYVGLSDSEMFPLILNDKNIKYSKSQLEYIRENKINAYKEIVNNCKSLDGFLNVKDFIISYSNQVECFAICSGSTREEVGATLSKLDNGELQKYFSHITTIEDVSIGKPSPTGYLFTASQLGLLPQDCLAIEDTQKGASAANDAGMSVVALSTTHSDFKKVHLIARNYAEIDTWIRGLGSNDHEI